MRTVRQRQANWPPGPAFQKQNGCWTFYHYASGVQQEAIEFLDEEMAQNHSCEALQAWLRDTKPRPCYDVRVSAREVTTSG
jgi:hypothetical protein